MKTHTFLFTVIISLFVPVSSFAKTADIDKSLADMVLDKYRSFDTYHAQWKGAVSDSNNEESALWEVAFDRKSKKVLFCIRPSEGTKKQNNQLLLLVIDGTNMHVALATGNQVQKQSIPIPDPNQLTYRDVRRAIPMLYPFDLPLIFSEYPFMEIIQGQVKEIKTLTEESDFYPGFAIYPNLEGETFAEYKIDPKTFLIQTFRFNYPLSSEPAVFTNTLIQTDKELPEDLFDFEKQLESYLSSK